jgi:hypothetical protein
VTEPTSITETTPETSRWIGRDVYDLIRACDAALDWADANARWFDISTAPDEGKFSVAWEADEEGHVQIEHDCTKYNGRIVKFSGFPASMNIFHPQPAKWHPPIPPPSNPPLPAPLERLGEVLQKVKGVG